MTDQYECPTCDYTSDTQAGISVHHHHAHGESIAKSEYECDMCGTVVERYDCNVNGDAVWCSGECEAEYKRNLSKEDHPRWKGGEVTVSCAYCGDDKQIKRHQFNRSEHFFCDYECCGEWKSENLVGPDNPTFDSVEVDCDWCGEATYKLEGRIERSERDFCSHDCHNKWMAEYQHGQNHHQWKGGRRDYGPGWHEQKREAVRERDDRECRDCGMSEEKSLTEFGRKLDVHHLVPPTPNTNPAVHNAKRNLVTLCIPCHHEREANHTATNAVAASMEVTKV